MKLTQLLQRAIRRGKVFLITSREKKSPRRKPRARLEDKNKGIIPNRWNTALDVNKHTGDGRVRSYHDSRNGYSRRIQEKPYPYSTTMKGNYKK